MREPGPRLSEGWYLMSLADLEAELARHRNPTKEPGATTQPLSTDEALARRNAGNLPDERGRSLRLVLYVDDDPLHIKRLRFEPDFHSAPTWRRDGGKPVNVVPLRRSTEPAGTGPDAPWWEQPDVASLEREWRRTGRIEGIAVPAEYRSFVMKTVASMREAGLAITIETIVASLSRWLETYHVAEIRMALMDARADEPPVL